MSADLIRQLAKWRHFPGYQLERRLDIFIAPYLQSFLRASKYPELANPVWSPIVIPELPLSIAVLIENRYEAKNRKGESISAAEAGSRTKKVDYGLFAKGPDRLVFLELKTDAASVDRDQVKYLLAAKRAGWKALVKGLKEVIREAQGEARMKYNYLLGDLEKVDAIEEISEAMRESAEHRPKASHAEKIKATTKYKELADDLTHKLYDKPLIVYLLPTREDELEIHDVIQLPFDELAEEVVGPKAANGDETAKALLKLLRELKYPRGPRIFCPRITDGTHAISNHARSSIWTGRTCFDQSVIARATQATPTHRFLGFESLDVVRRLASRNYAANR